MPITITIEQDPNNENMLDVVVSPPESGEPYDQKLLDLARLLVFELQEKLNHDPETCEICQGGLPQHQDQEPGSLH